MSEGEALGAIWSLATAIEHVHRIEGYELEQELYRALLGDETLQIAARPPAEEPRRYCQPALKRDPLSALKRDPCGSEGLTRRSYATAQARQARFGIGLL